MINGSCIQVYFSFIFIATSDRITYITDAKEAKDEVNNVGFCLTYTQKKC